MMMDSGGNPIYGLLGLFVLLAMYFIPTIQARYRRHAKAEAITVLNLLLGWTVLGWVAALVWALTENNRDKDDDRVQCPHCAEAIKVEAIICPHCRSDTRVGRGPR
jgi:hypothetical protein